SQPGRVAQWESACFTRKRSEVQNLPRPPPTSRSLGPMRPQSSLSSWSMPKVTLPADRPQEVEAGTPVGSVLSSEAICARVDGELVDLSWPIERDVTVEPVIAAEPDGLHVR